MNYNLEVIGERIKTARCKPFNGSDGYSQGSLAVALGLNSTSRTTIRKWERGEVLPPLEHLLKMCELFGCELGYLLGEYDLPTRTATDIQQETGLSLETVNILRHYKTIATGEKNGAPFETAEITAMFLKTLNYLLSHKNFMFFVNDLYEYGKLYNSRSNTVVENRNGSNITVMELSNNLRQNGWSLLSSRQAADYWLYSSLDTLRGIALDIWEDSGKDGNN